jgi:hypothetical protein
MAPGVIRPIVHIDRSLVAAVLARHEQATDAAPAHVAERHRSNWFVVPGPLLVDNCPDDAIEGHSG